MQPGYLPWLGFFELMERSDVFIIYDDVDYNTSSWRNRNRIRTKDGSAWLTVPVLTKGRSGQKINEVQINNNDSKWTQKHYKSLVQYYGRSPYFDRYNPFFRDLYNSSWVKLIDLDMEIINYMRQELDIGTKIIYSSTLYGAGQKNVRIIEICREFAASEYISPNGAKSYIEPQLFEQANIKLKFQNYKHPVYRQVYDGFVSHLSTVDLLFNHGGFSKEIIMSGSCLPNSNS